MRKFRTTIELNTGGLEDYSVPVEIVYSVCPGFPKATSVSPPEEATAVLESITVIEANGNRVKADWLIGILECDEELLNLCLLDWQEDEIAAEEYRAESRREDAMLRKWEGE